MCKTRFDTKSGQVFHCTLPCRHMCSKQALVCTASCSVLSISKTARTVTTNFRFWSTIRNPSGAYLIWGVSLETMKSPSGGFSALGGEWAPPSEAQNLRRSISVNNQLNFHTIMLCGLQIKGFGICIKIRSSSRSMMLRGTSSSNMRTRQGTSGKTGTTFKRSSCALQNKK